MSFELLIEHVKFNNPSIFARSAYEPDFVRTRKSDFLLTFDNCDGLDEVVEFQPSKRNTAFKQLLKLNQNNFLPYCFNNLPTTR